jgi:hypothetical protein
MAPPLSPLPASADFSQFMLPEFGDESNVDYGSMAQNLMNNLFNANGLMSGMTTEDSGSTVGSDGPLSPTPVTGTLAALTDSPRPSDTALMSPMGVVAPSDKSSVLDRAADDEVGETVEGGAEPEGDQTISLDDTPRLG